MQFKNYIDPALDVSYMEKNKAVIESQLRNAGTLLASCLDHVFSKATNIPVAPPTASVDRSPEMTGKTLSAGATITPDQATTHIGETVSVCGKVYGTKLLSNGPTFLNMGREYPNNPFTAIITFNKRSNFSYKPEEYLDGKTICVTGTIKNYRGKPEIIVDKQDQVEVK